MRVALGFFIILFIISCAGDAPAEYTDGSFGSASSVSSSSLSFTAGNSSCENHDDTDCVQVATFNLEFFTKTGVSWASKPATTETKKSAIAEIIQNNGLDLLALQEIDNDGVLDDLVNRIGGSNTWAYSIGTSGGEQRLAFLYKKSLVTLSSVAELTDTTYFESTNWDSLRKPFSAVATFPSGKSFQIVGLHLKAGSDTDSCNKRKAQVDDLAAYLDSRNSDILLLGDMNDEISGNGICTSTDPFASLESITGYEFLTTTTNQFGSSYSRVTNIEYNSVIDHLYVNANLKNSIHVIPATGRIADVVAHGDEENISDHQPVYFWSKTY